jgi:hypothetical protein
MIFIIFCFGQFKDAFTGSERIVVFVVGFAVIATLLITVAFLFTVTRIVTFVFALRSFFF